MDSDYLFGKSINQRTDRQHYDQKDKEELKDTKEVIRIHKSKNDRQHNDQKDKEELEDTKGVIRILSFWPLCCLSFFDLWILITSLVSSNSSLSFWPLCCLSFFDLWILITSWPKGQRRVGRYQRGNQNP
jgi:hypothetical protein